MNETGKRYECGTCDTQIICVKKGEGSFSCHGAPMQPVTAKPLPSSD
ncbi:hypothetical protein ACFYVR_07435 [Rhodococcus sp. NPDC003318]